MRASYPYLFFLLGFLFLSFTACQRGGDKLTKQINEYLAEDRMVDARNLLELELKKDPKNLDATFLMGWVRMVQGDEASALNLFGRCIHDDPRFYGGHKGMGALYLKSGKLDLAEKEFAKAIELRADSPELYMNLAQVQSQQGSWDAARETLQKGRSLAGSRADFNLLLAQNALGRNQPREALEILQGLGSAKFGSKYYRALVYCVHGKALTMQVDQAIGESRKIDETQRNQLKEAQDFLERCQQEDPKRFRSVDTLQRIRFLLTGVGAPTSN